MAGKLGKQELSLVVAATPVVLMIAGATTDQLLVSALLSLAVVPWAALLRWPSWSHHAQVLAGILTVTLASTAFVMRWYQEHPHDRSGTVRIPEDFQFLPTAEPIPHCVTFSGTGTVPAGDALVLFDRPTDHAGYYTSDSTFSYDGPVEAAGSGWAAPDVEIGSGTPSDEGTHITIVAVLVPQRTADFLDSITASSSSGALPPDVVKLGVEVAHLATVRGTVNAHCS